MANFFVIFGVIVLSVAFPTSAAASEKEAVYPSMMEVYAECAQAVKLAETDVPGFMKSLCASQITGYLLGVFRMSPLAPVNKQDPCDGARKDLYDSLKVICFPDYLKPKNRSNGDPVELYVAKDILAYLDKNKDKAERRGDWNKPLQFGFSNYISTIYSCAKQNAN